MYINGNKVCLNISLNVELRKLLFGIAYIRIYTLLKGMDLRTVMIILILIAIKYAVL